MSLLPWGRKRYRQRQAAAYAEQMADAYRIGMEAGKDMCIDGLDCPSDRAQFPVTILEAQQAGLFDGWVKAQCEIFDVSDEGIRAIEDYLGRVA